MKFEIDAVTVCRSNVPRVPEQSIRTILFFSGTDKRKTQTILVAYCCQAPFTFLFLDMKVYGGGGGSRNGVSGEEGCKQR
jgi:hypothetical protein